MKVLLHHHKNYAPHHKNVEGLRQMCAAVGAKLEITSDTEYAKSCDHDLIILNSECISPYELPKNAKIIYGPQYWVFPEGPLVGPRQLS